jgi:pimeloyl-ACP methyl ester carboxylesterase
MELVRQALGVDTLYLVGASYGGRLMLEYLRLFPAHVASYVIDSVLLPQRDCSHDLDRNLKTLTEDCDAVGANCPFASGQALWDATDELLNGAARGKWSAEQALTIDLFQLGDQPAAMAQWPAALAAGLAGNWDPMNAWHEQALELMPPTYDELSDNWTTFEWDPYQDNVLCIDYPTWNDFAGREFVLNQLHPPYTPLDQIESMAHIACEELATLYTRPPTVDVTPVASNIPGLLFAPRLDQQLVWKDAQRGIDEGLASAWAVSLNCDHAVFIDLGQPTLGLPEADQQCIRGLVLDWLAAPFDPATRECVASLTAPLPIAP